MDRREVIQSLAAWAVAFPVAQGIASHDGTPKYIPTELQSLKLQVKQKDAQLAQAQLNEAQKLFQGALAALTEEAKKVKTDNQWPESVQFDPNTLSFSEPKKEPTK